MLTDLVSLVQYALQQEDELVPFRDRIEERFTVWLAMQEHAGTVFTQEQRRWLRWMKDHITASMAVDASAFEVAPFTEHGGLGRAYEVFGKSLEPLMDECIVVTPFDLLFSSPPSLATSCTRTATRNLPRGCLSAWPPGGPHRTVPSEPGAGAPGRVKVTA